MFRPIAALLAAAIGLTACVTVSQNDPSPTATEQLLTSHAAERAAARLDLRLPRGASVYVDTTAVASSPVTSYAVGAVRAHLLGRGLRLVDRVGAAYVIELRIGADSIDAFNLVYGLPSLTIPTGSSGDKIETAQLPELSLYSKHVRDGVVELHAVAYDARTGALVAAVGPVWADTRLVNRHLLTAVVLGPPQELPALVSTTGR